MPDEEITPQQLAANREKANQPALVDTPSMNTRTYQLNINIAKVEDLPNLGGSCDP